MKALPAIVMLALLPLAGAGAALMYFSEGDTPQQAPTAQLFTPDKTQVSSCKRTGGPASKNYRCMRQAYGNVAYEQGAPAAMNQLHQDVRSAGWQLGTCHSIAHTIGHATMTKEPNVLSQLTRRPDSRCGGGLQHGAISYAFNGASAATLVPQARKICATMAEGSAAAQGDQCGHSVGHGLMLYTGNELTASTRVCADLGAWENQSGCYTGVYMEAFDPTVDTAAGDKANPYAPCATAPDDQKPACYALLADRLMRTQTDWATRFGFCKKAPGGWATDCTAGLSRRLSDNERDPHVIARTCTVHSADAALCMAQAAAWMVGSDGNPTRAAQLCNRAPEAMQVRCFTALERSMRVSNPTGSSAECRRLSPRAAASGCEPSSQRTYRDSNDPRVHL